MAIATKIVPTEDKIIKPTKRRKRSAPSAAMAPYSDVIRPMVSNHGAKMLWLNGSSKTVPLIRKMA